MIIVLQWQKLLTMMHEYDKTRNGMSTDMCMLVKNYIVESTAYVLQMKQKVENETEFDSEFRRRGNDLDNNLLQTLYDIRQIPWDRAIAP